MSCAWLIFFTTFPAISGQFSIRLALQFAPHQPHFVVWCQRCDDISIFFETLFMIGGAIKGTSIPGLHTLPIVFIGSFYLAAAVLVPKLKLSGKESFIICVSKCQQVFGSTQGLRSILPGSISADCMARRR